MEHFFFHFTKICRQSKLDVANHGSNWFKRQFKLVQIDLNQFELPFFMRFRTVIEYFLDFSA